MSDREAFEKWWTEQYSAHRLNQIQSIGGDLTGIYVDPRVERSWQAWQAAQAQAVDWEAVGVIDYALMAGVALTEEGASLPHGTKLYTAPPAAAIHHECCECSVSETTGWTQQAVCNVCNRIVEGVGFESEQVNRQDLIDLLIATRTQSEGVTADLIINMMGAQPAVNQQLLEAIKVCASFLSDFGLENSDAYQQALFAIAAAREQRE